MQIEEVKISDHIWSYVSEKYLEAGLADELIHGMRHMRHVREVCENICDVQILDSQVIRCLYAAVDIHDIGRATDKTRDHAMVSAEVFRQMTLENLTTDEYEAVHFAVTHHSRGLRAIGIAEAKSLGEIVLGLLCVCDHADAASPDGAARAALALKGKPILSDNYTADHLRELMISGCAPEMMNVYKNDSLVAHLAYDYCATAHIIAPVRHLLNGFYMKYSSDPRLAMFRVIVETYLNLQEKKILL